MCAHGAPVLHTQALAVVRKALHQRIWLLHMLSTQSGSLQICRCSRRKDTIPGLPHHEHAHDQAVIVLEVGCSAR